jgi:GNAT superfamily N-acetyltransferase
MIPLHTAHLLPLNPADPSHIRALAEIWNVACGPDLPITEHLAAFNLRAAPGLTQAGWLLVDDNWAQGVVLASYLDGYPLLASPAAGWIDALAVAPAAQRQGHGARLLHTAEAWLHAGGRTHITLGGSLRPFAPALPTELDTAPFFHRHGYTSPPSHQATLVATPSPSHPLIYDLSANLSVYQPPPPPPPPAAARPAAPRDRAALLAFLAREFPGRWHYEAELFLDHDAGRLADFMLLWTERGLDGACLLTFEDSTRPIARYYPYPLPRPWGQLGSIGVSASLRGQGYGSLLLDASLRRLHATGVNGCVIDWTNLLTFYGRFGFTPLRTYTPLTRTLAP